jgi:hypothetical protein
MMVIRKWEEVESPMSNPGVFSIGHHAYSASYCYITMQHTWGWAVNFPTGREEAEVFV